jgi:hypothetical protein
MGRRPRTGDERDSRRVPAIPFAGVAAGAATAVSTMIYGAEFAATGPLLAVLISPRS